MTTWKPFFISWNESDSFKNKKPITTNKNHKLDKHVVCSTVPLGLCILSFPIIYIGKTIPLWLNLPFKKTGARGKVRPLWNPSCWKTKLLIKIQLQSYVEDAIEFSHQSCVRRRQWPEARHIEGVGKRWWLPGELCLFFPCQGQGWQKCFKCWERSATKEDHEPRSSPQRGQEGDTSCPGAI